MAQDKIVGILGGMGPLATVDFMRRVLEATPAKDDADHLHLIIDSNAKVPSRIKALIEGLGEDPGPHIAAMAQRLEVAGADFLVLPCNTAHHYHGLAARAVTIPFPHIVELTIASIRAAQPGLKKIGLLASTALQNISLYEKTCAPLDIEVLYPPNQPHVMAMIKAIKAGDFAPELQANYQNAKEDLIAAGADCLVIGCTELSVIKPGNSKGLPEYDTLDILAKHVVQLAKG